MPYIVAGHDVCHFLGNVGCEISNPLKILDD